MVSVLAVAVAGAQFFCGVRAGRQPGLRAGHACSGAIRDKRRMLLCDDLQALFLFVDRGAVKALVDHGVDANPWLFEIDAYKPDMVCGQVGIGNELADQRVVLHL